MTNEEIKAAIKARGYTIKAFAEKMSVPYGTLRLALSGNRPLTDTLKNHILLALQAAPVVSEKGQAAGREVYMTFKIQVPGGNVVEEIGGTIGAQGVADRRDALAGIIRHNMGELVRMGARVAWSAEERARLGLPADGEPLPPELLQSPAVSMQFIACNTIRQAMPEGHQSPAAMVETEGGE